MNPRIQMMVIVICLTSVPAFAGRNSSNYAPFYTSAESGAVLIDDSTVKEEGTGFKSINISRHGKDKRLDAPQKKVTFDCKGKRFRTEPIAVQGAQQKTIREAVEMAAG